MIHTFEETQVSTNTAAELVGVKAGTIRQWISRGKLSPVSGNSTNGYLLDIRDVYRVNEETKERARRAESVPKSDAVKAVQMIHSRNTAIEDMARTDPRHTLRMAVAACIAAGVDGIPEIVRDTFVEYDERIRDLPEGTDSSIVAELYFGVPT